MHKTHFLDQKNTAKKNFLPTYLPYFFQAVTGNKQFIFLGLMEKCYSVSYQQLSLKEFVKIILKSQAIVKFVKDPDDSLKGIPQA